MRDTPVIFEKSRPGKRGVTLPEVGVPEKELKRLIPEQLLRTSEAQLPEVTELEAMRHYVNLSHKNHSIDIDFYPLGSCTMKYNPKINEKVARLPGFAGIHPYQEQHLVQGALQLLYELKCHLSEIVGLSDCSLQPAAGAHGELTGILMIQAYHESRQDHEREYVLVADSAHGTNPSSAAMCGFKVLTIRSNAKGQVDLAHLEELIAEYDTRIAGMMLTNPNTLGIFEEDIVSICQKVHDVGGLIYYDGANLNAIMGMARPGDMGFDVCHLNLHKTFSTPHGGGGPGAGPVLVNDTLEPFLPKPIIVKENDHYSLDNERPLSIGRIRSFYGNFGVLVRAYAYIRAMGPKGLKQASQDAVLNANYVRHAISKILHLPHDQAPCMHEFVVSAQAIKKEHGVNALALGKRLIDYGIHPPTVYFPLIVPEAMMMEPTETESRDTLDRFIDIMGKIVDEAKTQPEMVNKAPHKAPIFKVNEAKANRKPQVNWFDKGAQ